MTPIPFSIELWQQGYRPVTRDGRLQEIEKTGKSKPYFQGHIGPYRVCWFKNGRVQGVRGKDHCYDLFLLPPEDEMIVTIEVMRMNESGMKYIHISDVGKIKPGKYRLTKIG